MKLTLFFAGLIALATALPAAEAPDSIVDLSRDKGHPPSKTDDECMDHLVTCLAHECPGSIHNIKKFCWYKCKNLTIKWRAVCANSFHDHVLSKDHERRDHEQASENLAPREAPDTTCGDCKAIYDSCVAFSGVNGLNCEQVCQKRAKDTNPVCHTCVSDKFYPKYELGEQNVPELVFSSMSSKLDEIVEGRYSGKITNEQAIEMVEKEHDGFAFPADIRESAAECSEANICNPGKDNNRSIYHCRCGFCMLAVRCAGGHHCSHPDGEDPVCEASA